ncbi:carboxylate--amine ligase [Natrialbaceae archaeon A-gly3]
MTALVFNCSYNGLSIVRELGRRGVDVHAVDSFRNVGTTSRYATYHSCPNPTDDEEGFVEFLLEIAPRFEDRPVLFPTNDHWADAVASHRSRLTEYYRPCVADGETVDLLLDKRAFGSWAENRDYPVPRSWDGRAVEDVPDDAFPIAGKPGDARDAPDVMYRSSLATWYNRLTNGRKSNGTDADELRERTRLSGDLRLKVFETREELEEFLAAHPDVAAEFVFQEYVRGLSDSMYTVGIYATDGGLKGVFTGRKVRGYPPDVGDCKVGQAQSVPDHLLETTRAICADLSYDGIAEFEFKRDARTGEFFLIEVNPRSWSWVGITPACGVSLPWIAYADLTGLAEFECVESSVPDGSVKWVKTFEDFLNCLYFYRSTHPEWCHGPREWKRSVQAREVVYTELARDDPVPSAYSLALAARRLGIESKDRLVDALL